MRVPPRSVATLAAGCFVVCCTLGARADVYTWLDASGKLNVSNLEPPEGARVTKVVKSPPRDEAAEAAAAQRQLQALAERVRQLESEAATPPPAPPPPAPIVQYVPMPLPVPFPVGAPAPYASPPEPPTPATYGCDPSWFGCSWWGPTYSPSIVVVQPAHRRHPRFDSRPPAPRVPETFPRPLVPFAVRQSPRRSG